MGINKFESLLKNVIRSTGLKCSPEQMQNQSLRPTSFGLHKLFLRLLFFRLLPSPLLLQGLSPLSTW